MGPESRREVPDAVVWGLLGVLFAMPLLAWLSAHVASFVTSGHVAGGVGLDDATRAVPRLVGEPGHPDRAYRAEDLPGAAVFWATFVVLAVGTVVGLVVVGFRLARRVGRPGMARRGDLRHLSARAVIGQAKVLRPDLSAGVSGSAALAAAGVKLGRHHPSGSQLYSTVEDSVLVIAPPRTGKTGRVVIPTVLDYQGPAVVTSTRWDAVVSSAEARAMRGPVWVFDADQSGDPQQQLPAGARPASWSPVHGCDDPQTAMIRARSLARSAGAGTGIESGEFWATHATTVLQAYLHAAALRGLSIMDVRRWALEPKEGEPVTILGGSELAPSWGRDLQAQSKVADRQRDGVWGVVQQSLAALGDPRFVARCTPEEGAGFDPAELLERGGTLYLVGRSETQAVVAPVIAALVEAVVGEARARAARAPGGRLAPTLLVALDEVANIAPLPTLPTLVADGGGSGITTLIALQSRAQARDRWGDNGANAIIAACTHRLILGGGGELSELDDLSRLIGERDEENRQHSWQTLSGTGGSTSTVLRRVPIITPSDLQALPKGRGVLCSPNARPTEVTLSAWWERPSRPAPAATAPPVPAPEAPDQQEDVIDGD